MTRDRCLCAQEGAEAAKVLFEHGLPKLLPAAELWLAFFVYSLFACWCVWLVWGSGCVGHPGWFSLAALGTLPCRGWLNLSATKA